MALPAVEVLPQSEPRGGTYCGTAVFSDPAVIARAWQNTLARFPGKVEAMRKLSEEGLQAADTLGSQHLYWVYDFTTDDFDTLRAELMAVGALSYVWVSLGELANGDVTTVEVNAILDALEHRTPAASRDSTKGILQLEREYYGNPPNINSNFVKGAGDGRTHFLIYDIKDGWPSSDGYYAGYFLQVDVDPNSGALGYSNRRDMLYIDSNPGIYYNGVRDPQRPLSTLAHEFQHLIQWNYDTHEIDFFNEGLSEYAEYVCGYGLRSPSLYFAAPNVPLLSWSQTLADYSRAALWTLYLGEQYGEVFTRDLTQNPQRGPTGFDAAAAAAGTGTSFQSTAENFLVANIVQDQSAGTQYGYADGLAVPGAPVLFKDYFGPFAGTSRAGLSALAADYLRFRSNDSVRFNVTPTVGTIKVMAARFTDAGITVENFPTGSDGVAMFGGSTQSELVLSVLNTGSSTAASYTFQSSGAPRSVLELAHDDGLTLTTSNRLFVQNDTAFVVFGGVEGGKIDSVSMWFETPGSARLLIRDANPSYDVVVQPASGLGGASRMSGGPISFSVSDTTKFGTTIDLSAYGIRSSPDFVAELIYGAGAPNPVLHRDSAQGSLFSYLSLSGQTQPISGINMYVSLGDFYVRVYLSPLDSASTGPPPVPQEYALAQNYPNPVNSTTTIQYTIPEPGHVSIRLYDVLGREVAILVDRDQSAQLHSVTLSTNGLPSGAYLYRIVAGSFRDTKKLVVVR